MTVHLSLPVIPPDRHHRREAMSCQGQCVRALPLIEQRMADLCQMTRAVPGKVVVLDIQRRGDRGSASLRWRSQAGVMLSKSALIEGVRQLSPALRAWYADVQVQALWLNLSERLCRRSAAEYLDLVDAIAGMESFSCKGGKRDG
jgi:hypothetical protein